MNLLKSTGLVGLAGAVICGSGEFLLHFDPQARFSGYDFMAQISHARLTAGHFLAVAGLPLYFVGVWHIASMLQPAGRKRAAAFFLIGVLGFVYGGMWMSSRASIGSLAHYPNLVSGTPLIELYELRLESLLQVIRVTTLIISIIFIQMVLSGKSRYPKWMAATNPIVLLLMNFGVYLLVPEVGKYVMPIALNVGFTIFFLLSLGFGDTSESSPSQGLKAEHLLPASPG